MKNENNASYRHIARLIAFGVILYAMVMNLDRVGSAFAWVLNVFSSILLGLIIALILDVPMYGFQRLMHRIDRKNRMPVKLRDGVSLTLAVICVPILLFILLRFIIPQFISAVENVISIVQCNEDKIGALIEKLGLESDFIMSKLNELGEWLRQNITAIAGTAVSTVAGMFSSVADVLLSIILAIYLLADKGAIRRRAYRTVRAFLPEKLSNGFARCTSMFISTFRTFLSRQCLESLILGALILLCMCVFRVPYSFTIACMTSLLALIPYIGAYLSLAIGCVLIITISPMKTLIFIIIFLVAQQVEGNLIYPRVVGKSVGLPAYITLAAVMLGGAVAGIAGMFFVIPVISVAYDLLREEVHRRNAKKDQLAQGEQP